MALSSLVDEQLIFVDRLKRQIVDLEAQLATANAELADAQDDLNALQGMAIQQAATRATVLKGL